MLLPDLVGIDQPWTDKIKQWFPLKINRFAVHNGEVHYGDFNKEPKVDVGHRPRAEGRDQPDQ